MPRIIELKPDVATRALKDHHLAFANGPCGPCKGACCRGCAQAHGFLTDKDYAHNRRKYGWNKETGFQTDQGCRIPVHERSRICVGYQCQGYEPNAWKPNMPYKKFGEDGPVWIFSQEQRNAAHRLQDAVCGSMLK